MFKGWFKVHRSLFDNDLWLAEPFTKGQAWVDLIGHANHKPASVWIRGIEVSVGRGQLAWSELTMAKRWQWSRGKVRRYLGMLEKRQMIEQQKDELTTVLTICNYELYQGSDTADETASSTTDKTAGDTPDGQQTVHKQECKNGNNVKKPPNPPKGDKIDYSSWPAFPEDQTWKDWIAMRKKLKTTHSQTAMNRIGNELQKAVQQGRTVDECLSECVTRGWKGFKAEWMDSYKIGQQSQPQRRQPKDFPT